jgi:LEA14-like dessication related protein
MKRKWIPIALLTSLGILTIVGASVVSVVNKVSYEVLSYQVQLLDNEGVTFRIMLGITNPSNFDVEVWSQKYDVFVAGYKVSEIGSSARYQILRDNTSTIPLDVFLKWSDINDKLAPIGSQNEVTTISELPVLIKGRLSAKLGVLKMSRIPIRIPGKLGWYLP